MGGQPFLTPDRVDVDQPVLFGEGVLGVVVPEVTAARPVALLRAGHPGRIRQWYGLDHVIVEWFGLETSIESTIGGFGRDDTASFDPGLRVTDEDQYARRCERLRREWWYLQPAMSQLRGEWSAASLRLFDAEQAHGDSLDAVVLQDLRRQVDELMSRYLQAAGDDLDATPNY